MSSKEWFCCRKSSQFRYESSKGSGPCRRLTSLITSRRSGSAYGMGRSRTALTTLKIAVVTAMPSARMITAIAVKLGCFNNPRNAHRRSLIIESIVLLVPERDQRIDARRPSRRQVTRKYAHQHQTDRNADKRRRIRRRNSKQQTRHQARERKGGAQPNHESQQHEPHSLAHKQPQHVAMSRPERHANADFVCTL